MINSLDWLNNNPSIPFNLQPVKTLLLCAVLAAFNISAVYENWGRITVFTNIRNNCDPTPVFVTANP